MGLRSSKFIGFFEGGIYIDARSFFHSPRVDPTGYFATEKLLSVWLAPGTYQ